MQISEMRAAIADVYPNSTWRFRVERMPDLQVVAIYHKFKEKGQLQKPKFVRGRGVPKQLTVFDFI